MLAPTPGRFGALDAFVCARTGILARWAPLLAAGRAALLSGRNIINFELTNNVQIVITIHRYKK
jgi:hypothetical protein